jgi:glycosyltransferase involved in cell wall biosynthesis
MPRLSVLIIAKNEEAQIGACLESVRFADERVVVDSGSTDRTVEAARTGGARVVEAVWQGFAGTKDAALREVTSEWVLWLDADERVTPELQEEIRAAVQRSDVDGFYVARKAIFLGRWIKHCGWYPGYVCRLFRRDKARFTDDLVHESVCLAGPAAYLTHPLMHYTDPSLEHYLDKFNRYTSLAAQQMYNDHRHFRLTDLLGRPIFIFFKMFVLKRGFLDGMQGLVLCVLSACYVFTKYAKLWHLWQTRTSQRVRS